MPSLNKVQIIGNITREPEVKYTAKGTAYCDLGIATNRSWKDASGEKKEEVTYHGVMIYGRTAEFVGEYARKGSSVYVEGRLSQQPVKDSNEKKTKIIAEDVQLLGSRRESSETGEPVARPAAATSSGPRRLVPKKPEKPLAEQDDIPF